MTKVNENGQIEWTFEELDLEGAEIEVLEEMKLIEREQNILHVAMKDENLTTELFLKASYRFSDLSDRWLLLNKVSNLIYKLIMHDGGKK